MRNAHITVACTLALTLGSLGSAAAQPSERHYDAQLMGKVSEVSRPESVWIGAIEVRLRTPFVLEDQQSAALEFMRMLVQGRGVECRLTGERTPQASGGALLGDCILIDSAEGREIDLGESLIERGFARPCKEPAATIMIWPPVFDCQ